MRPGRIDAQTCGRGPFGDLRPHPGQVGVDGRRVRHHWSRELDQALEHLRLGARVSLADHPREACSGVERVGVDEEELLLDAQRPRLGFAEPVLGFVSHLPRTACTGRPAASQA